jgi:D-alanyl-D-alanine carboxypeptidase
MKIADYLRALGIAPGYGADPFLPRYDDAAALEDVEPNIVGRMQRLAPDTATAWRAMKEAAADDAVTLLIVSGFRSTADQAALIARKLAAGRPIDDILRVNVAPGFSQHHTGRAIDIATPGSRPLTEEFEATAAFAWLTRRASAFGFSMPYGRGNRHGISYEPWHWSRL